MNYIAHSQNSEGQVQTIKEHASGVGELMRQFALTEDFADLYEYCGMIHDMGKYNEAFQSYILGNTSDRIKHAIYGALFAFDNHQIEIALPVYGHHRGLPNVTEMNQLIKAERNTNLAIYESICNKLSAEYNGHFFNQDDKSFREIPTILQKELFVRLLYSALVDADCLDTERHFDKNEFDARHAPQLDADKLLCKLQLKFASLKSKSKNSDLMINTLRDEVRLFAESKASLPQGFFALTLPTGLGKTLCSINWALHHAMMHKNVKRIIFVLPFISIIDQTADELKSIFNDEATEYVLEHHSNIIYTNETNEEYNPKQLATENWDYPIIVTTSVQFFESLFSNRKSKCRKLHNIQDSIIIFDEIQTLPLSMTEPTLIMLNNLQQLCRCSILFCTATQPDFSSRIGFNGIENIETLVENPQRIFEQTRRVTYCPIENYQEVTLSELADIVIGNNKSALVVFNTKKKARLFFEELKNRHFNYKLIHLSTAMCPIHRKMVINDIREALRNNEYVIVSSTQLIEAGVDMDFPSVYRELAPLESIIQSAGRCNREGKLKDENGDNIYGDVFLFALTETGQPSAQYRSWSEFANLMYKGKEDKLYTHDFYAEYYRKLVDFAGRTNKQNITKSRERLLFEDVAEQYKLIDNSAQAVFVYNFNDESKTLYYRIKDKEYLTKTERQLVAQYSVQLYNIEKCSHFWGTETCGIYVWHGEYDEKLGLKQSGDMNLII